MKGSSRTFQKGIDIDRLFRISKQIIHRVQFYCNFYNPLIFEMKVEEKVMHILLITLLLYDDKVSEIIFELLFVVPSPMA